MSSSLPTQKSIRREVLEPPNERDLIHARLSELTSAMSSYFKKDFQAKIDPVFPKIEKIASQTEQYRQQLQAMMHKDMTEQEGVSLWNKKGALIEQIKATYAQVDKLKAAIKEKKLLREETQKEIERNLLLAQKEASKENKDVLTVRNSARKKRSALDGIRKSALKSRELSRDSSSSRVEEEAVSNLFKTLNYKKFKRIDKLFSILNDLPVNNLLRQLAGTSTESISKKVFNNYSADQYFDRLLENPSLRDALKKIEDL